MQTRERATDAATVPTEQLHEPASLGQPGGKFGTRLVRFAFGGDQRLGRRVGVGQGDPLLDGVQEGFGVFAFLGHDTKIRRQRARMIGGPVKVASP